MKITGGVSKIIDSHPKRAEIITRLLRGESSTTLAAEYGINHAAVLRTRKRLRDQIEPVLTASLTQLDPDFTSRLPEAKPLTVWGIVEDLNDSRRELDELKNRPDTKIHHRIQIVNTEARVAEVLVKIMETAVKNRDVKSSPEYQRLQAVLAKAMRRSPEAAEIIRDELRRLDPLGATDEV